MTGLRTTIRGPKDFIGAALHMEDNYPTIIEKAFYDKAVNYCLFGFPVVNFPKKFPSFPFNRLNANITEKRFTKLVKSFRQKAINLNPGGEYFIDKIAKKLEISIPETIKPERNYFKQRPESLGEGFRERGLRVLFEIGSKVEYNYCRTHP